MSKTLLLADDSVTIQKVVGISFASEDIEITTVDNGEDAVATARELRPDVILADVVMPGMSGYEVCEAIKADPNLSHVPVVLLTGTFEAFDEERASAVGASGHVSKPFEAQTLVSRVMHLLAHPEAPPPVVPRASGIDLDFEGSGSPAEAAAEPTASFDLEQPEEAFAFGDDDLTPEAEPLPAPPLASPPPAPEGFAPDPGAAPAADDAFDFSMDEAPGTALEVPVAQNDLAQTTLLDPAAPADDPVDPEPTEEAPWVMGEPLADSEAEPEALHRPYGAETDAGATQPQRAEAADLWPADDAATDAAPQDSLEVASAEALPDVAAPPAPTAEADPFEGEPLDADPLEGEPLDADPLEGEPLDADPLEGDPFDAEPLEVGPLDAEPLQVAPFDAEVVSETQEPGSADPQAPGAPGDAAEMLSPGMRGEIHEMLERIAWDALGPVSERIVQEALERIEQIAWEVVPKLAEALIEEEIRRLKGGPSSR